MDIREPKPVSLIWLWAGRVDDTWDRLKVLAIVGGGVLTMIGVALTLVGWIGTVVVGLGLAAVVCGLLQNLSPDNGPISRSAATGWPTTGVSESNDVRMVA